MKIFLLEYFLIGIILTWKTRFTVYIIMLFTQSQEKQIVYKLSINGGIIMSSPMIDVQQRQIYVTTLAGHVVAINCVSIYNYYL